MKRFLVCAVLAVCGCGQSGTSPVVEYNAAIQALDREIDWQKDARDAINSGTSDKELVEELKTKLKRSDVTIELLKQKIADSRSRL